MRGCLQRFCTESSRIIVLGKFKRIGDTDWQARSCACDATFSSQVDKSDFIDHNVKLRTSQRLEQSSVLAELRGESKSSCAASVNNRPAFSPCSFIRRNMSHSWLSSKGITLWHLSNAVTPDKLLSISEAKYLDEEKGLRERGVSAAEIAEKV